VDGGQLDEDAGYRKKHHVGQLGLDVFSQIAGIGFLATKPITTPKMLFLSGIAMLVLFPSRIHHPRLYICTFFSNSNSHMAHSSRPPLAVGTTWQMILLTTVTDVFRDIISGEQLFLCPLYFFNINLTVSHITS
jgi:hypothetical protein